MNLILETLIFGDGVNEVAVVVADSLLLFDDKFLTLLLLVLLPAFKFIRLSVCTIFLTM